MSRQSDLTNPSKAVREYAQLFNLIKLSNMKKIYNSISKKYNEENVRPELFSTEFKKASFVGTKENALKVILSWYNDGFSNHIIYRENDTYFWSDLDEPFVLIWFFSIDDFINEFKLPKSLKKEIEKL